MLPLIRNRTRPSRKQSPNSNPQQKSGCSENGLSLLQDQPTCSAVLSSAQSEHTHLPGYGNGCFFSMSDYARKRLRTRSCRVRWYPVPSFRGLKGESPNEYSPERLDHSNGVCWISDCRQRLNPGTQRFRFWGINGCWYRADSRPHVHPKRKAKAPAFIEQSQTVLTRQAPTPT